jgi:hypothetical protein
MKNAMARTVFAMLGMVSASPLHADMPTMERTKRENTQTFGDIKIRQSFSSMKDPMAPDFIVQVYKKGQLLLQLGDASFDTFVASPNKEIFVGLSNSGWPGTAAIIFDRRGRILLLATHEHSIFDYCRQTSTFMKEWFDPNDPHVRFPAFSLREKKAAGITLRNCRGETVDLLDVVAAASKESALSVRDEINLRAGSR